MNYTSTQKESKRAKSNYSQRSSKVKATSRTEVSPSDSNKLPKEVDKNQTEYTPALTLLYIFCLVVIVGVYIWSEHSNKINLKKNQSQKTSPKFSSYKEADSDINFVDYNTPRFQMSPRKDRKLASKWAKNVLKAKYDYLIFDCETTGLNADDEIVEISILGLDGKVHFYSLVKPTNMIAIPEEATAINGITWQKLKTQPTFAELLPKIMVYLRNFQIISYNAEFDFEMLISAINRADSKQRIHSNNWHCAMQYYAAYCGKVNPRFGDYTWQKLPSAKHSALDDCLAVLAVLHAMSKGLLSVEYELKPNRKGDHFKIKMRNGNTREDVESLGCFGWLISIGIGLFLTKAMFF